MNVFIITILLWFGRSQSEHPVSATVFSVTLLNNVRMELYHKLKNRNTVTCDINPTSTISSDVTNAVQSDARNASSEESENSFIPYVSSLTFYDKNGVELLRNYVKHPNKASTLLPKHLKLIDRYIKEWDNILVEKESEERNEEPFPDLELPIMVIPKETEKIYKLLRMIVRIYTELPTILYFSSDSEWLEQIRVEMIKAAMKSRIYFTDNHLEGLAYGMFELARIYNLQPSDIYHSDIIDRIPVKDFIYVGFSEAEPLSFREQLKWYTFARNQILKRSSVTENFASNDRFEKEEEIKDEKSTDVFAMNSTTKFELCYLSILMNITSFKFGVEHQFRTLSINSEFSGLKKQHLRPAFDMLTTPPKYDDLCNGSDRRDPKQTSTLKCKYDRLNAPWLYLMPVKVEIIHKDPQILFFHHVITDSKIRKLQQLALPIQEPSKLSFGTTGSRILPHSRFSFLSYLHTTLTKEVEEVCLISEYLTGLSVMDPKGSEDLQVTVYTSGGHYKQHMDTIGHPGTPPGLNETEAWKYLQTFHPNGDRMATLMFYLNDVERGGRTVFTKLGFSTAPEKGGAILWHSVFDSGEIDFRTYHAGCPVYSGVKWVANKWVFYDSQLFKKPCLPSLEED